MSARKWFVRGAGGLTGVAGPGDDALLYTKTGKKILSSRPNLAWGVRNIAGPLGMASKFYFLDQTVLGGASSRILQGITFGRYQAPESSWENSPKARLARWRARPVRMELNPPMISSAQLADQGYRE